VEIFVATVLAFALALPAAIGWVFLAYALWDIRRENKRVNGAIAFAAVFLAAFIVLFGIELYLGGWSSGLAVLPSALGAIAGSLIVLVIVGVSTNDEARWDGITRPIVAGLFASYAMSWIVIWTGFPQ